ncbi:hypothetical protein COOONC_10649, partial [Cooperia oncophora]
TSLEIISVYRFFCKTHLRLPLKEKIARIERSARLQEKNNNRDEESSGPSREVVPPYSQETAASRDAVPASGLVQRTATLSFFSPESLRDRTVQNMRDSAMGGPISPVSEVPSIDDRRPERAEFSNHLKKSSTMSSVDPVQLELESDSLSSSSDFECELEECGGNNSGASVSESDASISEDEGDELEEGDLEELERTVLQYSEQNPELPLTEEQVVSVIENINRRRNAPTSTPRNAAPLYRNDDYTEEVDVFHTPSERFTRDGVSGESPSSPPNGSLDPDIFMTPATTISAYDIRKKKAADLERLRTESRLKAKLKTDEELGLEGARGERRSMPVVDVSAPLSIRSIAASQDDHLAKEQLKEKADHLPEAQQATHATGLLSRLFTTETEGKSQEVHVRSLQPMSRFNANDVVHSESRKETNILANSLRRFKMRRAEVHSRDAQSSSSTSSSCTSPHPVNGSSSTEVESREVPFAAVAPSPRLDTDEGAAHISVNERNIRLFHKRAEKIRRQHDDERRRGAQEIQRGLQECEIRMEEIKAMGQSLELKLIEDPENEWAMDSWFALVHEREILKSKEEMLRLSKREVELEVKYRDLNLRFKQLGEGMNDNLTANSELLAAMLAVVEEKKEVNRLCEKAKQSYKMINANMKALRDKGRNFERFRPVFSVQ